MERFDEGTPLSIREHAAEWFLRLHAHDLNVAERFAYLQWLKASPVHIGETLQICKLYSILYPMKKQLFFTNEDDISNVIDLPREDRAATPSRTRSSWHVRALAVAGDRVRALRRIGRGALWFAPRSRRRRVNGAASRSTTAVSSASDRTRNCVIASASGSAC